MLPQDLRQTLDQLTRSTDSIIASAQKDVVSLENRLYASIIDFVSGLEKDKSGNIKPSKANVKKLSSLDSFLNNAVVDDKYLAQVGSFINDLKSTNSLMSEYFKKVEPNFKNDNAFTDISDDALLSPIENSLTHEGLSQAVNSQIKQSIANAVVTGYKPSDLIKELSDLIKGTEKTMGLLSTHVQQVTTDAVSQYTAAYFEVISGDLGMNWYLYEGGVKDTTRAFCQERHGKFYTKKEVQDWASLSWKGKIPTTNSSNIFIYRGGYQCRHYILPVSEAMVPEEYLKITS